MVSHQQVEESWCIAMTFISGLARGTAPVRQAEPISRFMSSIQFERLVLGGGPVDHDILIFRAQYICGAVASVSVNSSVPVQVAHRAPHRTIS